MNSKEAGVVIALENSVPKPIFWHLPPNRSVVALPDSRELWDVLFKHRNTVLGFAHSHPGTGTPGPSWTDITTFAAIEAGLGSRLIWWITSNDTCVALTWEGPHKHQYKIEPVLVVEDWLVTLRNYSKQLENDNGSE